MKTSDNDIRNIYLWYQTYQKIKNDLSENDIIVWRAKKTDKWPNWNDLTVYDLTEAIGDLQRNASKIKVKKTTVQNQIKEKKKTRWEQFLSDNGSFPT